MENFDFSFIPEDALNGISSELALSLQKLWGCPEAAACGEARTCLRQTEAGRGQGCEVSETCFRQADKLRESRRFSEAEELYRDCLLLNRELGLPRGCFTACRNLAELLWEQGRKGDALPYYLEGIYLGFELEDLSDRLAAGDLYTFIKDNYGLAAEDRYKITAEDLAAAAEELELEGKTFLNENGESETYYSLAAVEQLIRECLDRMESSAEAPLRYVTDEELALETGADIETIGKAVDRLGLKGRRLIGRKNS